MASNSSWGPFLKYWGHYCKDTYGQAFGVVDLNVKFSEGLLSSLYHETDVGSIPRGIKFDVSASKPQYADSINWKYSIQGCYWCGDNNTEQFMICCSKDCLFYFHDWCIERVEFFTKRRLCRLPGCDRLQSKDHLFYCSSAHRSKFDAAFPQFTDRKKLMQSVIRNGPKWYTNNESIFNLEFPEQFRMELIYNTDVGVIPRGDIKHKYLRSKFYESPNWSAPIQGCYSCGNRNRDVINFYNDMFCKERCQLVFYEWCRKKIERETTIKFCQLPGCPKFASDGLQCCNKEHSVLIRQKYTDCSIYGIERLINMPPRWYNKSLTPFESISSTTQPSHNYTPTPPSHPPMHQPTQPPPPLQHSSVHFVFSQHLTEFLHFNSDVGPIPREVGTRLPPPPPGLANQNSLAAISQCYWCCAAPPTFHSVSCSEKCFYLLNEWLHNKYTELSNSHLCRVLGCPNFASQGFQCCNRNHSVLFESSFKKYFPLLKETEFHLGPVWYSDYSRTLINFYHKEDPFYELTNFYPCTNLHMNNINWKTSEHYFQASKFAGTPYFKYVSSCPNPWDAFQFTGKGASDGYQKWTRPDWHEVKLKVMYAVLVQKFYQDELLLKILLRTGNARLVEHTKNNRFWGDGGDGSGENKLGTLLMRVRDHLRERYPDIAPLPVQQTIPIHNLYQQQYQSGDHNPDHDPGSYAPHSYNAIVYPTPRSHHLNQPISSSSFQPPNSSPTQQVQILERIENTSLPHTSPLSSPLTANNNPNPNKFKFSTKLIGVLSQYIDISKLSSSRNSHIDQLSLSSTSSPTKVDVIGCYWCESNEACFEEVACSGRCWFLLHEWGVRKVEQVSGVKLCALPGCEKPRAEACQCCGIEHIKDLSFMRGSVTIRSQEEVELVLGPKWYTDFTPINFSDSGSFSEFSNSAPSLFLISNTIWPTVEHYLSAQRLIGTPYLIHMSGMERCSELVAWGASCERWARPDWGRVREMMLYRALMAKFQQNCVLKGLLLRTRTRPLVCRGDPCLGDVLVSVREVLRASRLFPSINLSNKYSDGNLEILNPAMKSLERGRLPDSVISNYNNSSNILSSKCEQESCPRPDSNPETDTDPVNDELTINISGYAGHKFPDDYTRPFEIPSFPSGGDD